MLVAVLLLLPFRLYCLSDASSAFLLLLLPRIADAVAFFVLLKRACCRIATYAVSSLLLV